MNHKNWNTVNELATRQVGLWSVHTWNGLEFDNPKDYIIAKFIDDELQKRYCETEYIQYRSIIIFGDGLFFFDSEKLAKDFYSIFEMELIDSSAVYAALYSPTSGCVTENT